MGVWVRGHHAANFSHMSNDAPENSTSFDTKVVVVGGGANRDPRTAWSAHRSVRVGVRFFGCGAVRDDPIFLYNMYFFV